MYWLDREIHIRGVRVTLRLSEEERTTLERAAKVEEESGGVRWGDRAVRWGGGVMLGKWLRRAALLYAKALLEESDKAVATAKSDKAAAAEKSDVPPGRKSDGASSRGQTKGSRRLSDKTPAKSRTKRNPQSRTKRHPR